MQEELAAALFFWRMLSAFNLLLTTLIGISQLILLFRRKVPIDKELAEFVRESVCDDRHKADAGTLTAIRDSIAARLHAGDTLFRQIERALGRIEGKLEGK